MRTRIAAVLAAIAACFAVTVPAGAAGPCGGTYATNCYTWVCNRNCFETHCEVWLDVLPGTQSGCIG